MINKLLPQPWLKEPKKTKGKSKVRISHALLTPRERSLVIERRRAFSVFDEIKLNSRVANMSAQTIHQAYQSLARIADDFCPFLSTVDNGALMTICNIFLILRSGKRSRHMAVVNIGRHLALAVSQLDPNREFFTVYT